MYFLPVDLWIKGYLAMGIVMLVQSCVTLTKTVRDVHESSRFVNRIEDAKAERLLMEVSKGPCFKASSFQASDRIVSKAAYPVTRCWRRQAAGASASAVFLSCGNV